jgi:cytochrome c-type biogenesis protein CcmH/NrfG
MTLYLGVALVAAAVVLFLVQPVAKGIHASLEREDDEMTDTEARKRVALLALRDVEYDFLAGKLDEEDYRSLKSELTAEALAALEADDAAKAGTPEGRGVGDARLEEEIAAIRHGLRAGSACPRCSYANAPGSRFCSACGSPLAELATR